MDCIDVDAAAFANNDVSNVGNSQSGISSMHWQLMMINNDIVKQIGVNLIVIHV